VTVESGKHFHQDGQPSEEPERHALRNSTSGVVVGAILMFVENEIYAKVNATSAPSPDLVITKLGVLDPTITFDDTRMSYELVGSEQR
jgi:hypothetical protein